MRQVAQFIDRPEGGFPVENIAYWKEVAEPWSDGKKQLVVHFKSGGFIELDMTAPQFTSLVYGEPF